MGQFQKGDVVRLKSGGPNMTIIDLENFSGYAGGPKNDASCVWFEGNKKQEAIFDVAVLEKVK